MKTTIKPTKAIARKVLALVDHGLTNGLGNPEPGKMCVEAAVCYAFGLEHSDKPPCVGDAVRAFKIRLNDSTRWRSNMSRAAGMRRLSIAQLGSNEIDQQEFRKRIALEIIRQILPPMLRRRKLEAHAVACESSSTLDEAREAARAAEKDLRAAYAAAAYAAAAAAADAADVAADAACAACAAAAAGAYAAADAAERVLCQTAEIAVQVLIAMKCPGTKWLDLSPLPRALRPTARKGK